MNQPIVSVIIPTYKRNDNLERAINSVLNQTFNDLEIIVVDDNDETSVFRKNNENLMKKHENNDKVIYLKHKKNLNGAVARNTGITYSKSKYIAFLDDDDEYLEKKLEYQIKLIEQLDNIWGGVYCGYSKFIKNTLLYRNLNSKYGDLKDEILLLESPIGGCSTLLMKRSVLEELNGFDNSFYRHQDWELLIRFFRKYKIAFINRDLVKRHMDDRKNVPNPEDLILTKKKILNKFKIDIKEMPIELQKEVYKRHFLSITKSLIKNGNIKEAIKYYKKSKSFSDITLFDNIKIFVNLVDGIIPIKYTLRKITIKCLILLKLGNTHIRGILKDG